MNRHRHLAQMMRAAAEPPPSNDPDFVFEIFATAGQDFVLPTRSGHTYDCTVYWGDGTNSAITEHAVNSTHNYAAEGLYEVRIAGQFTAFWGRAAASPAMWRRILNGGETGFASLKEAFVNQSNVTSVDLSYFVASLTENSLEDAFRGFSSATSIDISGLGSCPSVTSAPNIFSNCGSVTELNLDNFQLPNVVTFDSAFNTMSSLVHFPDVDLGCTAVANARYMFSAGSLLQSVNPSWLIGCPITQVDGMFYNCVALTDVDLTFFGSCHGISTTNRFVEQCPLNTASLDSLLAAIYNNRSSYTWATPALAVGAGAQEPSGAYQDSATPTTGKEYAYKLQLDPDGEGFNTWDFTIPGVP